MSFDKNQLPEPIGYYEATGLTFKERRGKWRTTSCFNCNSSDAMRINAETGAFVCMTGCGAKGGDVIAYEMAHAGADFITACKALGAWVDDGRPAPTRPTPLPARDALVLLAAEANLVAVAAANVAHGVALGQLDVQRLLQAAGRIGKIVEVFA